MINDVENNDWFRGSFITLEIRGGYCGSAFIFSGRKVRTRGDSQCEETESTMKFSRAFNAASVLLVLLLITIGNLFEGYMSRY